MKKIFCVEDDTNIRELVEYTLKSLGFEFSGFGCAADFFAGIENKNPDLVLLDIMLPDKDGMEILQLLKSSAKTRDIPVILLTAKSSQINKIKGLDSGADDYITKPFDVMELVSRINAVLRRCTGKTEEVLKYRDLTVDTAARRVSSTEEPNILLTYKEFELLKLLLLNHGIVLTRDVLMNKIWGTDFEGETRTVDVHIRTLRQKLGECGEYIETVRNVGYKIR
ncbi:MAG: response regulator transcription factor [Clostridia bacterium]|nr:response regulator transcription factor [Clostridia bacterium]